jgi:flagellar motor switch/type III secretory pathway protein FliN
MRLLIRLLVPAIVRERDHNEAGSFPVQEVPLSASASTIQIPQPVAPVSRAVATERSAKDVLPWLPCTLALEVPLVGFTVGSLLELEEGSLVQTACSQSSDIPLRVNGVLMAFTEFEVLGERLAARITELL